MPIRVVSRLGFVLCLAMAAAGCEPQREFSGYDALEAVAAAVCAARYEPGCPPLSEPEEDCARRWLRASALSDAAAAEVGQAAVDTEALDACLSGIDCVFVPMACHRVIRGRLAEGAGCQTDAVCGPGLLCQREPLTCGVCVASGEPREPGAACERVFQCAQPADDALRVACSHDTRVCVVSSYVDGVEDGPCDARMIDAAHIEYTRCPYDTACSQTDAGRRCLRPGPEGSTCALGFAQCDAGLTCSARSQCVRVATDVGSPCAVEGPVCATGLWCAAGLCESVPDAAGDACDLFDAASCPGDLGCIEGVCVEPAGPGARCLRDADCESRFCDRGLCATIGC